MRDGEAICALNNAGYSNWYKNVLQNPEVILEIKGQKFVACAQAINDTNERHQIFNLYKQQRAGAFQRFFGVPVDAPEVELERALESRVFVRFTVNG